jgi:hypothetical protein
MRRPEQLGKLAGDLAEQFLSVSPGTLSEFTKELEIRSFKAIFLALVLKAACVGQNACQFESSPSDEWRTLW